MSKVLSTVTIVVVSVVVEVAIAVVEVAIAVVVATVFVVVMGSGSVLSVVFVVETVVGVDMQSHVQQKLLVFQKYLVSTHPGLHEGR